MCEIQTFWFGFQTLVISDIRLINSTTHIGHSSTKARYTLCVAFCVLAFLASYNFESFCNLANYFKNDAKMYIICSSKARFTLCVAFCVLAFLASYNFESFCNQGNYFKMMRKCKNPKKCKTGTSKIKEI